MKIMIKLFPSVFDDLLIFNKFSPLKLVKSHKTLKRIYKDKMLSGLVSIKTIKTLLQIENQLANNKNKKFNYPI